MSYPSLVARQTRYELRAYWRNVPALVFTFAFPIMFLVVFGSLNHNSTIDSRNGLNYMQFFVPGIISFAVLSACYTNLGMRIPLLRDSGVLKRMRGTPLPASAYVTAIAVMSIVVAIALAALVLLIGFIAFGVHLELAAVPAVLLTLAFSAACMCSLGLAIASVVPSAEAAAPIVQFSIWPVLFISNIFYPIDNAPAWLDTLANLFPVRHMADAMQSAFDPATASTVQWTDLGALAIWIAIGMTVAVRRFRWEPARKG